MVEKFEEIVSYGIISIKKSLLLESKKMKHIYAVFYDDVLLKELLLFSEAERYVREHKLTPMDKEYLLPLLQKKTDFVLVPESIVWTPDFSNAVLKVEIDTELKVESQEEPKEELKKELKIEPKEDPKEKPKSEPKEEPKSDPKEEPKSDPKEEPKSEPKEKPKSDPKEEPKSDPKEKPKSDPKEEPKSESKEKSKKEINISGIEDNKQIEVAESRIQDIFSLSQASDSEATACFVPDFEIVE